MTRKPTSTLVYTTDPDPAPAVKPTPVFPSASSQTARIRRERKGRGGKTVTIVAGLQHNPATFATLLRKLKQVCGAGGTLKDGELEIQGDHRERITDALAAMGYGTKQVGG